jgi:hypothetical protein
VKRTTHTFPVSFLHEIDEPESPLFVTRGRQMTVKALFSENQEEEPTIAAPFFIGGVFLGQCPWTDL